MTRESRVAKHTRRIRRTLRYILRYGSDDIDNDRKPGAPDAGEYRRRSIDRISLAWSMLPLPRLLIDSLEMLSRSQKDSSRSTLSLSLSPPSLSGLGIFSPGRKGRPASRGIRVRLSEALLTYRLPSISYSRNIADHNGRARNCICIRGELSRSAV